MRANAAKADLVRHARLSALRMLAGRRLTEAQLADRLERKGFPAAVVANAVETCRRGGYLDDRLFAQLYVASPTRALGDARLVAELVRKGIDRHAAAEAVAAADQTQAERLTAALEKLRRTRPSVSYPSAARALERLGFPAGLIYRVLRDEAARYGPLAEAFEEGARDDDPLPQRSAAAATTASVDGDEAIAPDDERRHDRHRDHRSRRGDGSAAPSGGRTVRATVS